MKLKVTLEAEYEVDLTTLQDVDKCELFLHEILDDMMEKDLERALTASFNASSDLFNIRMKVK